MDRLVRLWRLTATALLATAAACTLATSAGAQDSCAVADRLLEAKLYDKARVAYAEVEREAVRDGAETPECVKAGLRQIFQARAEATQHFERGKQLEELQELERARDEYVEAVRADPTFDEASAALDRLLQPSVALITSEERYQVVRTLEQAGLHEAATEELKEAIKAAEPGEPIPPDMKNLVSSTISPWGQIRRGIEPVVRTLAEIAIALLLVWVLFQFVSWWRRQRRLRLDIQDFDKGTTGLDLGKALPALVEEAFRKCDTLGKRSRVELLTGPIDKDRVLSNITSLDPRLSLISQLVDVIVPPNVVTLTGSLQRSKTRGAGVSLTLTEGRTGKSLASESIWLTEFDLRSASVSDDSESYYGLAEPAAIWTLYRLQEYLLRLRRHRGVR